MTRDRQRILADLLRVAGWLLSTVGFILLIATSVIAGLGDASEIGILGLLTLIVFGALLEVAAVKAFRVSTQLGAPTVEELLSEDPRQPVIYLRSFGSDRAAGRDEVIGSNQVVLPSPSYEQVLVTVLKEIGPVIAIGQPGERLPPRGAARLYPGDEWEPVIWHWLTRCRLAVLRAGTSHGVLWELGQAIDRIDPEKLALLIPDRRDAYDSFRQEANKHLPIELPELPAKCMKVIGLFGYVRFDADWQPHFEGFGRLIKRTSKILMPSYAIVHGAF